MELKIFDQNMAEKGKAKLPEQFSEEVRPDLIKRAVLSLQSRARQSYGADPRAGKRASARVSKRRHDYRGSYGHGISRVPRKVLSRRGTRMYWVGAEAPGTVGGRRAHPPKSEKVWAQKINTKERRKAIRSAISATLSKELATKRGHYIPDAYPFIIDDSLEKIQKTKEAREGLLKLGFEKELSRAGEKTIRAGKGKQRGRKYKTKKGPLIVVSEECPLIKSARKIPGVDVVLVNELNAELLAPGANPGRLTLFSKSAVDRMGKEKLFTQK